MSGRYICREQVLYHEDIGVYKTYGIFWDDKNFVDDVSCDRKTVEQIVDMLNLHCVDIVHMHEVIENLIIE